MARVLVAMSGGVDSSVAAALLRDAGHDVTGVTLKLWGGDQDSGCCSVSDVEDARRVAAQLGIPHYVFNLSDAFDEHVVDPYVAAYSHGETPNPCIDCNRTMKWGVLFDRMQQLGFDRLATGHHARLTATVHGQRLARGVDPDKDQSYVLYMLRAEQLACTELPIGALTKREVRARAESLGLRTAAKRESMDVCFITRGGRDAFLGARIARAPGRFVDTAGHDLGGHPGIDRFTIGQRRGLGVALGERAYVIDIDAASNTVTIGERGDLLRSRVTLRDSVWVDGPPGPDVVVHAQARAHGDAPAARVVGDDLVWVEPQPRVAPGQAVVAYDGDVVLGGGVVAR